MSLLFNIILNIFIKQQICIGQIKKSNYSNRHKNIQIINNTFKKKYAVTNMLEMYMKQTTIF